MLDEILSLSEWKKKRDILKEYKRLGIKMNERSFRKQVEINNRLYGEGQVDYYIAHSNLGYIKTFDWNVIEKSIADKRKRALTMLAECSRAKAQYHRRNNLKMEEIYENKGF